MGANHSVINRTFVLDVVARVVASHAMTLAAAGGSEAAGAAAEPMGPLADPVVLPPAAATFTAASPPAAAPPRPGPLPPPMAPHQVVPNAPGGIVTSAFASASPFLDAEGGSVAVATDTTTPDLGDASAPLAAADPAVGDPVQGDPGAATAPAAGTVRPPPPPLVPDTTLPAAEAEAALQTLYKQLTPEVQLDLVYRIHEHLRLEIDRAGQTWAGLFKLHAPVADVRVLGLAVVRAISLKDALACAPGLAKRSPPDAQGRVNLRTVLRQAMLQCGFATDTAIKDLDADIDKLRAVTRTAVNLLSPGGAAVVAALLLLALAVSRRPPPRGRRVTPRVPQAAPAAAAAPTSVPQVAPAAAAAAPPTSVPQASAAAAPPTVTPTR